jgi:flavin reductase (DIM6/NTAB) family NADH-FMN oxidoreductase RutF
MTSPFEHLAATLDYPLFIVTTAIEHERAGCLVGFATQCSIHPPRFLACISIKNHTLELARRATALAVHVVEEQNKDIAVIFGGETADEVDKFEQVNWHYEDGMPILDACDRWFVGSVLKQVDLGDHVGFLLAPIDTETTRDTKATHGAEQLTYQHARDIKPGHKP